MLTIDFDIVMGPSLEIYNDQIDGSYSYDNWRKECGPWVPATPPIDLYKYDYLTGIIATAGQHKIPVYFIDSHEEITYAIKDSYGWWPEDKDSCLGPIERIINIDHHHDAGYSDTEGIISTNPNCGDWVQYLKDNKMLEHYTWVNNTNSSIRDESKKYVDEIISFDDFAKKNSNYVVDGINSIYVCASYPWVPESYHPLFMAWKTMYDITHRD